MDNRQGRSSEKRGAAEREAAEALAVEALAFLADDPARLGRFLAETGIGPEAIRDAAREPDFLAGVLQHIVGDERLLLDFAAHAQIKPAVIPRACAALGGAAWERDVP
jgi:hypothetical protein